MIDEDRTMQLFGYTSNELSPKSSRTIVVVCEECGKYRTTTKNGYRDLCNSCAHNTRNTLSIVKFVHEDDRFIDGTGIDRIKTIRKFGYDPIQLLPQSNQPMIAKCMGCGVYRTTTNNAYKDLCRTCKFKTSETRYKMSLANRRPRGPMPDAQKKNLSRALKGKKRGTPTDEVCRKISESKTGTVFTDEHKRKISASVQGIDYTDWDGFVDEDKYCHNFNSKLKTHIRCKYDWMCVMCDMTEEECKSVYGEVLSVHHIDKNKDQGCNGHKWKLIPLCKQCHGKSHHDPMKSRIDHLLLAGKLDVKPSKI